MIYSCFWLWIGEPYHKITQDWCILSTYIIIRYMFHDCIVNAVHLKVPTVHTRMRKGSSYLYWPLHSNQCTASCEVNMNFATESVTVVADNVWNEEVVLIDHKRCWKCCPSTHRHSSHQWRRLWFTFWSCSAEIFAVSLRVFSFSPPVQGLLV
jgi:hypothetical protein